MIDDSGGATTQIVSSRLLGLLRNRLRKWVSVVGRPATAIPLHREEKNDSLPLSLDFGNSISVVEATHICSPVNTKRPINIRKTFRTKPEIPRIPRLWIHV